MNHESAAHWYSRTSSEKWWGWSSVFHFYDVCSSNSHYGRSNPTKFSNPRKSRHASYWNTIYNTILRSLPCLAGGLRLGSPSIVKFLAGPPYWPRQKCRDARVSAQQRPRIAQQFLSTTTSHYHHSASAGTLTRGPLSKMVRLALRVDGCHHCGIILRQRRRRRQVNLHGHGAVIFRHRSQQL
jgi:hypothetical protein